MGLDVGALSRRYGVPMRGVVHVGAHAGQEFAHYEACGLKNQVWVEPQPGPFAQLRAALPNEPRIRLFNVACGSSRTTAVMHEIEGNRGLSNSLLEPDLELKASRWKRLELKAGGTFEVPVVPLDELLEESGARAEDYSLLSIDTQGYELEVLRGATRLLEKGIQAIDCEVSTVAFYKGSALLPEIEAFVGERGFVRVFTKWGVRDHGDAFFVRRSLLGPWRRWWVERLGPAERGKRPSVRGAVGPARAPGGSARAGS